MVALSSTQRLTYAFDAAGQRLYPIAPTCGRFTYAYDAAGRITRAINPEAVRTSYSYDSAGRRTFKFLANGLRASFIYDNANQLIEIGNQGVGTVISDYAYRYDPAGNPTSVKELDGSRVT